MEKAYKKSVITVPHIDTCWAVQAVKDFPDTAPHEWSVWHMKPIRCCDENGKENPPNTGGKLYYEFNCADDDCPAKKRVLAEAVAKL